MKNALITGITGQDGSYLAELLLEKGYNVYVSKYAGTEVKYEGQEYIIVNQDDILAIID